MTHSLNWRSEKGTLIKVACPDTYHGMRNGIPPRDWDWETWETYKIHLKCGMQKNTTNNIETISIVFNVTGHQESSVMWDMRMNKLPIVPRQKATM